MSFKRTKFYSRDAIFPLTFEFEEDTRSRYIISANNVMTTADNTTYATIEALQEEVRMRDEKITSLEARLAAIEEMLNNK